MSDNTLYPIFYGTRMVTFDVLRNTFEPHMHPEAARRGFGFILHQNGKFGVGGGYRALGTQPNRPGFAPEGSSFHQPQKFPSGTYYVAWDMVVVNPGGVHRAPRSGEVPWQGTQWANELGWHMNISSETWHGQPIELDGHGAWVFRGRPDLVLNRKITTSVPSPVVTPPRLVTETAPQPTTKEIKVEFKSRYLKNGVRGPEVKFFQRILNDIGGQGVTIDGIYGPQTARAVTNWQVFFGLHKDGEAGPQTQGHMIEIALLAS